MALRFEPETPLRIYPQHDRLRADCASHRRGTLICCRVDDVPPIDVRDVSRASLRRTMTSMIHEDARRRPRGTESRGATMSREATQYR